MIRRLSSGDYRLYSREKHPRTGKRRVLGTFETRTAARDHERTLQERFDRRWIVASIAIAGTSALFGLGIGVYLLLNPSLSAGAAQALAYRDVGNVGVMVVIAALVSTIMAGTLVYTSRRGYVYCGRTEWVTKDKHPRLFWTWFSIHLGFVTAMAILSLTMYRML